VRTFLVNGLAIQANQDEAVALVDRVVNDHIDVNGIMSWLAEPGRLISIADASL
jgi:prophage maintenance system killer protein